MIKKVAFADYFASIATAYFSGADYQGSAVSAFVGVLAFSMQIYFDFSGYTDIARGCARLLGYRFPPNFERPYLSPSITDFWRRWHISLSFWLRDYLYISLGGNRVGVPQMYLNILIVMGLGGLWHGASWNFALWGLFHGLLLIGHRLWRLLVERSGAARIIDVPILAPLWVGITFAVVTLGWVPFRAPTLAATRQALVELATWPDLDFLATHQGMWLIPLGTLAFCLVDRGRRLQDWLVERARFRVVVATGVAAVFFLEIFARIETQVPFVYFQF